VGVEVVLDGALQWDLGVEPDQRVLGVRPEGQAVRPASSPPACPARRVVAADRLSGEVWR
jgi:hypothetical protein